MNESEWNFTSLLTQSTSIDAKHHLRAAISYEYARESSSVRNWAAVYGDAGERDWENEDRLPLTLFALTLVRYWTCICWPKFFPGTPWLEIPVSDRKQRVAEYLKTVSPSFVLRINERDLKPCELPRRGARLFFGHKEHLVVQLNWAAANNSDIVRAFEQWVRESRPPVIREPRSDATRENVNRALLTRLAVTRLLHAYPFNKAKQLAERGGIKMPDQQSDALKMRRQVLRDMHLIFQMRAMTEVGIVLLTEGERPRSWPTATERRRFH